MALIMCFVAFSIDAVLPALALIGSDLGVSHVNDVQWVITGVFFGVAAGQLLYGRSRIPGGENPQSISDLRFFIVGSLVCLSATDMQTMLLGRFLQGLGAAGPRIVTLAIVGPISRGADGTGNVVNNDAVYSFACGSTPDRATGIDGRRLAADFRPASGDRSDCVNLVCISSA